MLEEAQRNTSWKFIGLESSPFELPSLVYQDLRFSAGTSSRSFEAQELRRKTLSAKHLASSSHVQTPSG